MIKDIYIAISSKGGVGKSTATQQIIIPFLSQILNKDNTYSKKIKVYEVDANNDSSKTFENTQLFETHLIKNPEKEFKKTINSELCNLKRDYPIVIDIGVGYFSDALKTLSESFIDDKIHFIVPTKAGQEDFNNTVNTIQMIKNNFENPNIIIALSDAVCTFSEKKDLREEFGWHFGELLNLSTGKKRADIFKITGIEEKYFSLKKDDVIDKVKGLYGITIYETLNCDLIKLRTEMSELKTSSTNPKIKPEEFEKIQISLDIKYAQWEMFTKAQKYAKNFIVDNFRNFEMLL